MHILLIHQFFLQDNEGGGSRWNELSRIWIEAGHKVTVISGNMHYMQEKQQRSSGLFCEYISSEGARVIRCYVSAEYHRGFPGRLLGYFSFVFSASWAGLRHARKDYDLVIATSPPLLIGLSAFVIARWKRLPLVVEIRDLWPESAIETGILRNKLLIQLSFRLEKFIYRKAAAICALTPAFRDVLVYHKKVAAGKVFVIPSAADFHWPDRLKKDFDIQAFRREMGLESRFVITYVGAHGVANHLVQVLDAAALLAETRAHFLLIGDGAQKQSLIQEAARRGLSNITFIDAVPKAEVFRYILASDAGLSVLKRAEIFRTVYSNKTFDYFSCAKPVLLAIDGVSRDLIESADAGIFIEPENPKDFADKIHQYLTNPESARRQGENGYQYARQHFDRTYLAEKYFARLLKLCSEEGSGSQ